MSDSRESGSKAFRVDRRSFLTGTALGISSTLSNSAAAVFAEPDSKAARTTRLPAIPTVYMGYAEFTEDPRVEPYRPPVMIGASAKLPDYPVLT